MSEAWCRMEHSPEPSNSTQTISTELTLNVLHLSGGKTESMLRREARIPRGAQPPPFLSALLQCTEPSGTQAAFGRAPRCTVQELLAPAGLRASREHPAQQLPAPLHAELTAPLPSVLGCSNADTERRGAVHSQKPHGLRRQDCAQLSVCLELWVHVDAS